MVSFNMGCNDARFDYLFCVETLRLYPPVYVPLSCYQSVLMCLSSFSPFDLRYVYLIIINQSLV